MSRKVTIFRPMWKVYDFHFPLLLSHVSDTINALTIVIVLHYFLHSPAVPSKKMDRGFNISPKHVMYQTISLITGFVTFITACIFWHALWYELLMANALHQIHMVHTCMWSAQTVRWNRPRHAKCQSAMTPSKSCNSIIPLIRKAIP